MSASTSSTSPPRGPVFVAGASGRTGQRIVRTLLSAGVPVRAGCRSPSSGRKAVGDVDGDGDVEYVKFDVTDEGTYADAIGDARVVVSALGAGESLNLLGPTKVDGLGCARLMRFAATAAAVEQLVMVSSIGVGKPFGFPAALLNLFGGVLLWKGYAEAAMERAAAEAGKAYFTVRPGGMERAKDDFKEENNIVLKPRGSLSGGVISRLQVAEIVTAAILDPDVARCVCVEAVTDKLVDRKEPLELLKEFRR